MKVFVDGKGLNLGKRDFVAQGGEGSVYMRRGTAYKVYSNAAQRIPAGKIQELSAINDPRVVKPEKALTDASGQTIGYTMRFIDGATALCRLFTRSFREREGIDPAMMFSLVGKLREGVEAVHAAGIQIVDLNELNFLVAKDYDDVYFIDVDSYQTPRYPATAIMDSVRDRHAKPGIFSEATDWFSFAVVSFQMQIGIHPYKGKHPQLRALDQRMQSNVSVFDPEVRVPRSAYPLDVIPEAWRGWYRAVFEAGERTAPPVSGKAAVAVTGPIELVSGSGAVEAVEIGAFGGRVRGVWARSGRLVVATERGLFVDGRACTCVPPAPAAVGFTPSNRPIGAYLRRGRLELVDLLSGARLALELAADAVTSVEGRLYAKSGERLAEVQLHELGGKTVAAPRLAANVMAHATRLYSGCIIQDLLGATWVGLFPRSGVTHQQHLRELDDYQVIDARYDSGVLMVLGVKAGRWDRLVVRFASDFQSWDLRVVEDVGTGGLNFVTLDSGVTVCLTEADELELSPASKGAAGVKRVQDAALGGDMVLSREGGRLLAARRDRLYRLAMK